MTETTNHRFDEAAAPQGTSTATATPDAEHVPGAASFGAESEAGARETGTGTGQAAGSATGAAAEPGFRRFRRRRDGLIAGVCGGAGDLLGVDATLVRVGLVAATILGFGSGILLYLVCWVLVPQD